MILKNNTRHVAMMRNFYSLLSNLVILNSPDLLNNEIINEKIQYVSDWLQCTDVRRRMQSWRPHFKIISESSKNSSFLLLA